MSTLMNEPEPANPKMMDVAVPANMRQGLAQEEIARRGWAVTAARGAWRCSGGPTWCWSICASAAERERHGAIPGALHAPYPDLQENIRRRAGCCTNWPPRPASGWCSIALSASARRQRLEHLQLPAGEPARRRGADHRSGARKGRPLRQADARSSSCRLVKAVDTHLHADHITGLGALRDRTHCMTVMGDQSQRRRRVDAGRRRRPADHRGREPRRALHARPHRRFLQLCCSAIASSPATRCSSAAPGAPTSRTATRGRSGKSLFGRLLRLPDETLVFPAHDYKGDTVSTIAEEKALQPATEGARRPTNTSR